MVALTEGLVAAYCCLTAGQVDTLDAPDRIRKGMGQYPLPVVVLARLAVATHAQGESIGLGLLRDAIRRTLLMAEHAGIRAMLTHPIDKDAARFYTRFGFIASPLRPQQLLLLLRTHGNGCVKMRPLASTASYTMHPAFYLEVLWTGLMLFK